MLQRADFYRSREENAGNMFPRHEPIVHSAGAQREQGPLAQQQLAQFERDGFLWLENFFTPEMVAALELGPTMSNVCPVTVSGRL